MEVECFRHPGASTIGSQSLNETAPMAGKSWPPSLEPLCRREVGCASHWYNIYNGNMRGGDNPESMLEGRIVLQQTRGIYWTTEDHWLHRLICTSSKHALVQVHEQTQQNTRECRSLTDTLVQVPHETPLGMKEHWQRHWHYSADCQGNQYALCC